MVNRPTPVFVPILLLLVVSASQTAKAQSVRCEIDPDASLVSFTSQAPFETFVGKTQAVTGFVDFDPQHVAVHQASISVDAASLKTGNRLRDKDMRNKFLETDRYPRITFVAPAPSPLPLKGGEEKGEGERDIRGTLAIHGVERMETVHVHINPLPNGDGYVATAHFPIALSDYRIERPRFLWMRLAETVDISVQLSCSLPRP